MATPILTREPILTESPASVETIPDMLRILIADDHAVVREGLKKVLTEAFPDVVCEEVEDGPEALRSCERQAWDLLILDLSLPSMSGLDVLINLKESRRNIATLVLSIQPEVMYARRVFRLGAAGYLSKRSAPQELARAVRKILSGGRYVSPATAEELVAELAAGSDSLPHERLSDREFQIFCLIASGRSIKEVAQALSLSPKTISTYRNRVLQKMNMQSNAELTVYAVSCGLVGSYPEAGRHVKGEE